MSPPSLPLRLFPSALLRITHEKQETESHHNKDTNRALQKTVALCSSSEDGLNTQQDKPILFTQVTGFGYTSMTHKPKLTPNGVLVEHEDAADVPVDSSHKSTYPATGACPARSGVHPTHRANARLMPLGTSGEKQPGPANVDTSSTHHV